MQRLRWSVPEMSSDGSFDARHEKNICRPAADLAYSHDASAPRGSGECVVWVCQDGERGRAERAGAWVLLRSGESPTDELVLCQPCAAG